MTPSRTPFPAAASRSLRAHAAAQPLPIFANETSPRSTIRTDAPAWHTQPGSVRRSTRPMNTRSTTVALLICLALGSTSCKPDHEAGKQGHHEAVHAILATHPLAQDMVVTQKYVCQIHSRRHIEVRAMVSGYLDEVLVQEGQAVKQGDVMFKLLPVVYDARRRADQAELDTAQIKLRNTEQLFEKHVVSDQEVALAKADLDRAKAKFDLASAELAFTEIKAPFDGIVDRQFEQHGSLVEEGDILTTASDNQVMWVYFNVPEVDYLAFHELQDASSKQDPHRLKLPNTKLELQLANGTLFGHAADDNITIESTFDHETGNLLFRADFPNPDKVLRHGQTGTMRLNRTLPGAIVIPQRSTFEVLDKRYVFVVGDDGIAHQRRITVSHEREDVFVVADGLQVTDKIVLDGVRQVHDGAHVDIQLQDPKEVLKKLKHRAE